MQLLRIRLICRGGGKKYILYPFGTIGMMTKNVLNEQFNIQPAYILDNYLCNTNKNIKPLQFLNEIDMNNYLVLLTSESAEQLEFIRNDIYKICPRDRVVEMFERVQHWDTRISFIRKFAEIVREQKMSGSVAECGVFQGHLARCINEFFCDKKLYLFDSFESFSEDDMQEERKFNFSQEMDNVKGWLKDTSVAKVMSKMSYPDNIVVKKGYIPDTLEGVEDEFCFVHLDMDVYKPTTHALRFFYPRMVKGGVILMHDYYAQEWLGIKRAVEEFEAELSMKLPRIPAGDDFSMAIIKA